MAISALLALLLISFAASTTSGIDPLYRLAVHQQAGCAFSSTDQFDLVLCPDGSYEVANLELAYTDEFRNLHFQIDSSLLDGDRPPRAKLWSQNLKTDWIVGQLGSLLVVFQMNGEASSSYERTLLTFDQELAFHKVTKLASLSQDLEFHQPKNSISATALISSLEEVQILGARQNYGVMQIGSEMLGAFALSKAGKFKVVDLYKVTSEPALVSYNKMKVKPKRSSSYADFDIILITKDIFSATGEKRSQTISQFVLFLAQNRQTKEMEQIMIHEDQPFEIDKRATRSGNFDNTLALLQKFKMDLPPGEGANQPAMALEDLVLTSRFVNLSQTSSSKIKVQISFFDRDSENLLYQFEEVRDREVYDSLALPAGCNLLVGADLQARAKDNQQLSIFISDLAVPSDSSSASGGDQECLATELRVRELRLSLNASAPEIRFDRFEHAITSGSGFRTLLQISSSGQKIVADTQGSLQEFVVLRADEHIGMQPENETEGADGDSLPSLQVLSCPAYTGRTNQMNWMECEHCSLIWNRAQGSPAGKASIFGRDYSFPSYESSVAWSLCGDNLDELYYKEPSSEGGEGDSGIIDTLEGTSEDEESSGSKTGIHSSPTMLNQLLMIVITVIITVGILLGCQALYDRMAGRNTPKTTEGQSLDEAKKKPHDEEAPSSNLETGDMQTDNKLIDEGGPQEKSGLPLLLESARPTALKTSEAKIESSSSKPRKEDIGLHLDHSSCRAGTGEGPNHSTVNQSVEASERPKPIELLEPKEIMLELPPAEEEEANVGEETGDVGNKGFNTTQTSQGWKMGKAPTPANYRSIRSSPLRSKADQEESDAVEEEDIIGVISNAPNNSQKSRQSRQSDTSKLSQQPLVLLKMKSEQNEFQPKPAAAPATKPEVNDADVAEKQEEPASSQMGPMSRDESLAKKKTPAAGLPPRAPHKSLRSSSKVSRASKTSKHSKASKSSKKKAAAISKKNQQQDELEKEIRARREQEELEEEKRLQEEQMKKREELRNKRYQESNSSSDEDEEDSSGSEFYAESSASSISNNLARMSFKTMKTQKTYKSKMSRRSTKRQPKQASAVALKPEVAPPKGNSSKLQMARKDQDSIDGSSQ